MQNAYSLSITDTELWNQPLSDIVTNCDHLCAHWDSQDEVIREYGTQT